MAERAAAFDDVGHCPEGRRNRSRRGQSQIQLAMEEATAPIEALVATYNTATEQIKTTLADGLLAIDDAAKRELEVIADGWLEPA